MILHAGFSLLSRFADGALSGLRRHWVANHLARCSACRQTVSSVREWTTAAQSLPVPQLPADALDRILERRAAGVRVILPVTDPAVGGFRLARPLSAAALLVLLAGSSLVLRSMTRTGELEFVPARPQRGEEVMVVYSGDPRLAEAARVTLWALTHASGDSSEDPPGWISAGELVRDEAGVFRGAVRLSGETVYAQYAVGRHPPRHGFRTWRRTWELLVHDEGAPEHDALVQKQYALIARLPVLNR